MAFQHGKQQTHSAYVTVSGTNSAQLFGSVSNAKWVFGGALMNWWGATVSQQLSFVEVGNLASATKFMMHPSMTSGQWGFNFLPLGLKASDTNTTLVLRANDTGVMNANFWACGFYE